MSSDLDALRAHNEAAERRRRELETATRASEHMRAACAELERLPSSPIASEAAAKLIEACELLGRFGE